MSYLSSWPAASVLLIDFKSNRANLDVLLYVDLKIELFREVCPSVVGVALQVFVFSFQVLKCLPCVLDVSSAFDDTLVLVFERHK